MGCWVRCRFVALLSAFGGSDLPSPRAGEERWVSSLGTEFRALALPMEWADFSFAGFSSPVVSFLPRSLARWRNAVASDASSNRFKELLHAHVTLDRTCLQKYFFVGDAEEIRCSTSGSLVATDFIEFVLILYCEYAEFYPC